MKTILFALLLSPSLVFSAEYNCELKLYTHKNKNGTARTAECGQFHFKTGEYQSAYFHVCGGMSAQVSVHYSQWVSTEKHWGISISKLESGPESSWETRDPIIVSDTWLKDYPADFGTVLNDFRSKSRSDTFYLVCLKQ
jgi:hypothetical protein